ncbi:MAG: hypothetical protein PF637_13275 [Spirochaetes bacterium]|jgi:hypothetical protein|nr:hypothetical protein [Spirochaetota bacterium]
MRRSYMIVCAVLLFSISGCATVQGFFKSEITVDQAIIYKNRMDKMSNPAQRQLMKKELDKKIVVVPRAKVVNIIESMNVDYKFAVVVRVETDKGPVDLYLYSNNIKLIASLQTDSSEISAKGDFSKFFQLLDDSYIKIELVKASINKL